MTMPIVMYTSSVNELVLDTLGMKHTKIAEIITIGNQVKGSIIRSFGILSCFHWVTPNF